MSDDMEKSELENDVKQIGAELAAAKGTANHLRRIIHNLEQELRLAYTYIGASTCRAFADRQPQPTDKPN